MTPNKAAEAAHAIRDLQEVVRQIGDTRQHLNIRARLLRALTAIGIIFRAIACIRYAIRPMPRHDWCLVFDSGRISPYPGESLFDFLNRVGRTNRTQHLPEILGITAEDRIVAVDVTQATTVRSGVYGTFPYIFALAGPIGTWYLIFDTIVGLFVLKSPRSALIYSTLRLVSRRSERFRSGLLMTTSVTWLAEVLRNGLSANCEDLDIVEVLHGAGTQNTGSYFQSVHDRAQVPPRYINLIAGLPRYSPLSDHMIRDTDGEIACNLRLWQGRDDPIFTPPNEVRDQHSIIFIGGASVDGDYSKSSYFRKEISVLQLLEDRKVGPIFYAPHPRHKGPILEQMLSQISFPQVQIVRQTTLELILGGSIVVGGLSSSLVEAALLGIPSFAYEDFDVLFIPETAALVDSNTDVEELTSAIEAAFEMATKSAKQERMKSTAKLAALKCGIHVNF